MRRALTWTVMVATAALLALVGYELGATVTRSHTNTAQIANLCRVINVNLKMVRRITLLQRRLVRVIALERQFSPELLNYSERTFRLILLLARPHKCNPGSST